MNFRCFAFLEDVSKRRSIASGESIVSIKNVCRISQVLNIFDSANFFNFCGSFLQLLWIFTTNSVDFYKNL